MPSSKRDYPSSLYAEHGTSYKPGGYSNSNSNRNSSRSRSSNSGGDSYAARRSSDSHHGYNDHRRGRGDRNERPSRDSKRDSRRDHSYDRNTRKNGSNSGSSRHHHNGRSSSMGILERFIPSDFRPSQADPEARHHRLSKEKECEGFDWTQGVVLGLIGATALFSVEKSLVKRKKKDYIE
ncbi:hypothetical protein ACHAQJ_004333 [Trichoderma viride]